MAHEVECHVFAPATEEPPQQYRKRRRNVHSEPRDGVQTTPFVPLMRGEESEDSCQGRYEVFEGLWQQQEESLHNIIEHANTKALESLRQFVDLTYDKDQRLKIPTGLILHGPENGAFTGLLNSLSESLSDSGHALCIYINSAQSPNLKTVLKYINRAATSPIDDGDETRTRGSHLLSYDLQNLCDHVNGKALNKVVLLFGDSEAFDGGLLSDLIVILSFWKDRVPFVFLFGIATSIELFQSKLSQKAIRCLEGRQFDVEQASPEEIFKMIHRSSRCLFLGPGLSRLLVERQRDFILDLQILSQALKYAYMTHFFSNPLSLMLGFMRPTYKRDREHYAAIRHLPSFRRLVQRMIDSQKYTVARRLLDDDTELEDSILKALQENSEMLQGIVLAVDLLSLSAQTTNLYSNKILPHWSELYILAMSGKLSKSLVLEETLTLLKRVKSNVLQDIFESIMEGSYDGILRIPEINGELANLLSRLPDETILRSNHDIQHSNLRTTVVAQKVELSRHAAKVTAEEAAYTSVIDKFIAELEGFFESKLINPQELFLHEVFIYDVKSLHREVFLPRPRFAIERALSSPHDYLGCDCCNSAAGRLCASQPATAIVYQLYLESGSVINTADLWSAFWTIVGSEESKDRKEEKERALALFSRALAELKYLGMIKNSRKKADHLAKLSWKGL